MCARDSVRQRADGRAADKDVYRHSTFKLVLLTVALTVAVTAIVIVIWEQLLRPPFFAWVEARYPGEVHTLFRWNLQQRVEHFFISAMVDVFVVTLLLGLVNRKQRRLEAEEDRYRALFEHANDGIAILRADDHRIVEVNERFAAIVGVEAAQLPGRRFEDLGCETPGGAPAVLADSGEQELIVCRPSGEALPALASANTLDIGGERLVILIVRDLSERKRLERERETMQAQLARNEKAAALGQMAAQVAHEVNNPLAGLRLYTLHFKERVAAKLPADELALIDKIVGGVERLSVVTGQILDFARPLRLSPRQVNVVRVVEDALDLLGPHAAAAGVTVAREFGAPEIEATLDEATFSSAVFNLALNAVQAMAEDGAGEKKLTVSARVSGGVLGVVVEDTGPGMSPEEVARAFEPFYTTKSKGLGLGMPYARKVVEEHGGSMRVEGRAGAGTRITINLPAEGRVA